MAAQPLDRPVFVVGSGRSGTTVVGELLGHHHDVVYLNEPRYLWNVDPRTNVWQEGMGRIHLSASDLTPEVALSLKQGFSGALAGSGRSRLVEKTPINSFRIGYLDALCPDARFLHVIRDGRYVAASIAQRAAAPRPRLPWRLRLTPRSPSEHGGSWYGSADFKWRQLRDMAESEGIELEAIEEDLIARGLVEWRLAVTICRRSLSELSSSRWAELRYEDLTENPASTMREILAKLELAPSTSVLQLASKRVRASMRPALPMNQTRTRIAGELLGDLGYLTPE